MNSALPWMLAVSFFCCAPLSTSFAQQDQRSAAEAISNASRSLNSKQKYRLQYKLKENETIRWNIEDVASTKAQMSGESEETSMRSETIDAWHVTNVDARGNITFSFQIESVNMWQKFDEQDPVAYNSTTDDEVPEVYQPLAKNIGKPQSVFQITPNGQIKDRKSNHAAPNLGFDVTVPLPIQPVPVGYQWNVPIELGGTDEDGNRKSLKARVAYELIKVKGGNAYISFRTEVLTPVESQSLKSQIMQKMIKGYVVFDVAQGRPLRREFEWDETVQGFQGPDSFLQYIRRRTEKLVDGSGPARTNNAMLTPMNPNVADRNVQIKTREGKPIIRK